MMNRARMAARTHPILVWTVSASRESIIAGGENSIEFAHTAAQLVDSVTWIKGRHSLKFGGSYWGAIMGRVQFQSYAWTFQTDQAFAMDKPQSAFSDRKSTRL